TSNPLVLSDIIVEPLLRLEYFAPRDFPPVATMGIYGPIARVQLSWTLNVALGASQEGVPSTSPSTVTERVSLLAPSQVINIYPQVPISFVLESASDTKEHGRLPGDLLTVYFRLRAILVGPDGAEFETILDTLFNVQAMTTELSQLNICMSHHADNPK